MGGGRKACARGAALACLLIVATAGEAQTQTSIGVPAKGHGSVASTFQYIAIEERNTGFGVERFGRIDLRSLYFSLDYGLTDRLALSLWMPFKSNRYRGDFPHDPRLLLDPRGERFLDDGDWHSSWGDWGAGLRWQWLAKPVAVTPFVSFHHPSRRYPYFTETQAGTRQWRLDLGVNAGGRVGVPRWNMYWEAGVAYSVMEKTRPRGFAARRVNHSMVHVTVGKLLSPRSRVHATLSRRDTFNALDFPGEFNPPFVDDLFYWHDQLLPWEYTTASLGYERALGTRYQLLVSYGRTVELRFGHRYDHAVTVGLQRAF